METSCSYSLSIFLSPAITAAVARKITATASQSKKNQPQKPSDRQAELRLLRRFPGGEALLFGEDFVCTPPSLYFLVG